MLSYNPIFIWTIWLLFFIAVCTTAVIRQATTFLSLKKDTRERVHTLRKTGGFLKTPTPVITTSPGDRVTNLQDQQNRLVLYPPLQLQCNPVNTVTNGPKRFGRMCINGVFSQENVWQFFTRRPKKSRRDNEVREVNREAQSIHKGTGLGGQKGVTLIQLIL